MSRSLLSRLLVAATLLSTVSFAACNTGNEKGATNVESDAAKDNDPTTLQPATRGDSATSGLQPNRNQGPSTRQVYEEAASRKDRNNDGIAD